MTDYIEIKTENKMMPKRVMADKSVNREQGIETTKEKQGRQGGKRDA